MDPELEWTNKIYIIDDMDIYYDCSDHECIHYKPCMMLKYQHPDLATTHSIEPSCILFVHGFDKILSTPSTLIWER